MAYNENFSFAFIPAFLSVTLMMNTFNYDAYNNTDAYIGALPNGKTNAVKSKYISTLLLTLLSVLITLLVLLIINYTKGNINLEETLSITLGSLTGIIILQAIIYPLIYKFGIEKSRIGLFVGIFGTSFLIAILYKIGFKLHIPKNITTFLNDYYLILIPIILIILITISYIISKKIYIKKEY